MGLAERGQLLQTATLIYTKRWISSGTLRGYGCLIQRLVRICGRDTPHCGHGMRKIIASFTHTEFTG
jgi:hypothetical protein